MVSECDRLVPQERPDVQYHLVAVDFLPPLAIQAAMTRLACEFARGAPLPRARSRSPPNPRELSA